MQVLKQNLNGNSKIAILNDDDLMEWGWSKVTTICQSVYSKMLQCIMYSALTAISIFLYI